MSGATWCVLICQEFYDGVPSYCAGEGLLAVTTRPPCRVIILKRGDFIASSALRPRRAHSLRNKRSARALKYFAPRKRSSCLITSMPQSCSSSRFTASHTGFFDLSQSVFVLVRFVCGRNIIKVNPLEMLPKGQTKSCLNVCR